MEKSPVDYGWPAIDYPPERFAPTDNVGIKLGDPSGGLVDVDCDCPEAIALAPHYLPATTTFGREGAGKTPPENAHLAWEHASKRRHWLYRCRGAKTHKPAHAHLELRSTKTQTVFPGSLNRETGNPIEWTEWRAEGPLELSLVELEARFWRLAAATILARAWPRLAGNRHDTAFALGGALRSAGWTVDEAVELVRPVLEVVREPDFASRLDDVTSQWNNDDNTARFGWPTIEQLLGPIEGRALQRACEHAKPARPVEVAASRTGYACNDGGNADRLLDRHGADLRHARDFGWLRWTGARWQPIDGPWIEAEAIAASIRAEAQTMGGSAGKALDEWGRQSGNASKLRGCLEVASHRPGVAVGLDELDADPWQLNTPAGILDLRTGAVQPPYREALCTKSTSIAPDFSMPTPRFLRFLRECMGDDLALAAYLLRFLGYSLTGDVREHALGIWHGPQGANGKSTLINLMSSIMGDYAGSTAPEVLLAAGEGAHPTGIMDLRGRRLVTSVEAPEGRQWNESLVKQLTGGDEVKARAMRQDFVAFRPTWKLVLATNSRPVVREQGGAFWRRVQLVPWLVSFRGREDRGLARALEAEAPGILALLVGACVQWQQGGLQPPPAVLSAVDEYRASQDTIGAFMAECVTAVPGAFVSRTDMYRAYNAWCGLSNVHVLSAMVFYRVLEERGWRETKTNGTRGYRDRKLVAVGF